MGIKEDMQAEESHLMADLLRNKFEPIGNITMKKMFLGYGIFHDGKMFGMINSEGLAFLKVNGSTKKYYEEKSAERHSKMPYYTISKEILDNQELFTEWALKSIELSK